MTIKCNLRYRRRADARQRNRTRCGGISDGDSGKGLPLVLLSQLPSQTGRIWRNRLLPLALTLPDSVFLYFSNGDSRFSAPSG